MNALIVSAVCKETSCGAIAYNLHKYLLEHGHESIVCYGRGKEYADEEELIKIDSNLEVKIHAGLTRLTGLQGYFSNKATKKLIKMIEEFKPDVVYLLNLHGYYINEFKLLSYLKKIKVRVVYLMPDEYPFLGKCCYSNDCEKYKVECNQCPQVKGYPKSIIFDKSNKIFKMKEKLYQDFKRISFASVKFNIEKAKKSKLLKDQDLLEIDWGIDLKKTYYPRTSNEIDRVKEKYKIPKDKKIILAVAPFKDQRKGIKKYFFECAKQMTDEKTVFINVGFNDDPRICPSNFIPIKYVSDQNELACIYSLADIFVITSMSDTMPLACLIALGCGTRIIGFNVSGIPYIAEEKHLTLVEPGNLNELIREVKESPFKTDENIKSCREYALGRYCNDDFNRRLVKFGESN